jgi:hypothetical protein
MTTITCKLPDDLAARLDRVALNERRSKSAILREALEQRLKARRKPVISAYDLVKQLCGTVVGGASVPCDLATNPQYLKGFGE